MPACGAASAVCLGSFITLVYYLPFSLPPPTSTIPYLQPAFSTLRMPALRLRRSLLRFYTAALHYCFPSSRITGSGPSLLPCYYYLSGMAFGRVCAFSGGGLLLPFGVASHPLTTWTSTCLCLPPAAHTLRILPFLPTVLSPLHTSLRCSWTCLFFCCVCAFCLRMPTTTWISITMDTAGYGFSLMPASLRTFVSPAFSCSRLTVHTTTTYTTCRFTGSHVLPVGLPFLYLLLLGDYTATTHSLFCLRYTGFASHTLLCWNAGFRTPAANLPALCCTCTLLAVGSRLPPRLLLPHLRCILRHSTSLSPTAPHTFCCCCTWNLEHHTSGRNDLEFRFRGACVHCTAAPPHRSLLLPDPPITRFRHHAGLTYLTVLPWTGRAFAVSAAWNFWCHLTLSVASWTCLLPAAAACTTVSPSVTTTHTTSL